MSALNHTIRGCTTAADLDDGLTNGARWLVVPAIEQDTLYVTHDDSDETVVHIFTNPAERHGLRRVLTALLWRPQRRLTLAAD